MHVLVFSVFRSKLKLLLSVLIFTVVLSFMMVVINSYDVNSKKIAELKKTEMKTVINVLVESLNDIEAVEKISHIGEIERREIVSGVYSLTINIDEEKYTDYVEKEISSLNLDYSRDNIISPELEMYIEIDNFNKIFIIVIIIGLILLLFIELKLQFTWESKNILFLNIMGYKKSLVLIIVIARVFISIIFANIFSTILFLMFYTINHFAYNVIVILLPALFCIFSLLFLFPIFFFKMKKLPF